MADEAIRVLVTGGRGRLAQALAAASSEVTALPRAQLDISEPDQIERELDAGGYAVVVNAAAVAALEAAEAEPDHAIRVNTIGPGLLATACAGRLIPLIHLSTDYVFGAATSLPWREDDPVSPVNAYGRSKAEGEARVLAAGPTGRVVRVAWLFGDDRDFISQMLRVGRREGQAAVADDQVAVADDQVGSPTPIRSAAERLLTLCARFARGDDAPPILHLVGSPPVSRADWVSEAFGLLTEAGIDVPPLRRVPMATFASKATRPNYSALDGSTADALFGSSLRWREGLAECIRAGAYRDHD
jgi:dTDP-4-dehydrorhamnose reductase